MVPHTLTSTLITLALSLPGVAFAQATVCPPAAITDQAICYDTGDVTAASNRATLTYTPTRAFVAGSEICAYVDLAAELEPGGWDQVYLRFSAGATPTSASFADHCLVGDQLGSCESDLSPGCESLPTVTWQTATTICWQPPAGTTSVTLAVYVKTLDDQYQCGDCDGGGSPGVTVNRIEVTGCNGFPATGLCGDGVVGPGEGCDDDNTVGLDGCSATCQLEPGAVCNAARTACAGATSCDAVAPGPLAIPYCYENGDTDLDSPLVFSWSLAADGSPLRLAYDISGGLELSNPDWEPYSYDELWVLWEDDLGGFDFRPLNVGQGFIDDVSYEVWSRGTFEVTPTAGATRLTAVFFVFADGSFSCAQDPDLLAPLSLSTLSLSSCRQEGVTTYDSFAAFSDALAGCFSVIDFNDQPDGRQGPISGDGFTADSDSGQPIALRVEHAPYPSTFAQGDGTPALDPQIPERYASNSRLRIDFEPEPARAIGLTFIDVGDIGGAMGMEAYRDGRLVAFVPDLGVSNLENNFITWRGFVFDQPVDAVVFSMLEPADHFNLDNLVIVPQADADDDSVPDLCDCAPGDPKVAGRFGEVCDDLVDNDCDGFVDGQDGDCGGTGTASCSTHADLTLDQDSGGWLVAGDTAWAWSAATGRWAATSANGLDARLETQPLAIPGAACPGDFEVDLELGGVVSTDGDSLMIEWSKNGGAWTTARTLAGTLSPITVDLSGLVVPGDLVSFRFAYRTNASGVAIGPSLGRLRLYSDDDGDADGTCDGCDCAPTNAAYGEDCDRDDDGWCAADTGPLNANPVYADCLAELAGGNPQVGGSDCDDAAATANPGLLREDPFCADGLDNDCDGPRDASDPECAAPTCTDPDGDGYGSGPGCLGADCLEGVTSCTTDCADADADGVPECNPAERCVDLDRDGYGQGPGCAGPDCDDDELRCAVDCTTDRDSDRVPDCAESCVDADGDQYGLGPSCLGLDCDDQSADCRTDCRDVDSDQVPDCRDGCLDGDKDGAGVGTGCAGTDCDDTRPSCAASCADLNGNQVPDCGETCADADGDGYGVGTGCEGPDCAEGVAACNVLCRDTDGDTRWDCDPADVCIDKDGDGFGTGQGCTGADCDDGLASCTTTCRDTDADQRLDCDPADTCLDADRDGYGAGAGCLGADCEDTIPSCAVDCSSSDGDATPDCAETCVDADGDGYGVGPACKGADCKEGVASCNADCRDLDLDGLADCEDPCLDGDKDGFGVGAGCQGADCDDDREACAASCADLDQDGTPDCAEDCADGDGDGFGVGTTCLGADCDDTAASCAAECVDRDTDGSFDCTDGCIDLDRDGFGVGPECQAADCDDTIKGCTTDCADRNDNDLPDCNEGCRDEDRDGFGVGADCGAAVDCDDRYPACTNQCTHTDQDGIPDCADEDDDGDELADLDEQRLGTNPLDPDNDDDGLMDGDEVHERLTDPRNPDTDGDGLKDGAEVLFHATDPKNPDTDAGGVMDGAEVAAGTNPLDPSDDSAGEYRGSGCAGAGGGASFVLGLLTLLGLGLRRRAATRG